MARGDYGKSTPRIEEIKPALAHILGKHRAFVGFALTSAQAVQRNVLLIIADDYGIDSNSLYNTSPEAALPPTPNINALKASGVMFRHCYAMPTCSPARATILTGRNPSATA